MKDKIKTKSSPAVTNHYENNPVIVVVDGDLEKDKSDSKIKKICDIILNILRHLLDFILRRR